MDSRRIAFDFKQARGTEDAALRKTVGPWLIRDDQYSRSEEMHNSRTYMSKPSSKVESSTFPRSSYCRWCQRPFWRASELEEHETSTEPRQRSDGLWICRTIARPIERQIIQDGLSDIKLSGSSSLSEMRKLLKCPYSACSEAYTDRILLEYHLRVQHPHQQIKDDMAKFDDLDIPGTSSWTAFHRTQEGSGREDTAIEEGQEYSWDEDDDELGELLEIVSPKAISRGHGTGLRQRISYHSLGASFDSDQSPSPSRKWYYNLASPGSFQTAHSSLASYATALSGSLLDRQNDLAHAGGHLVRPSDCVTPEMPAVSTEPSDAFERFVEVITTQAIAYVASSAGILCLSEEESERLKSLLIACLRPVRQVNTDAYRQAKQSSRHNVQTDLLAHKIVEHLVGYKISNDPRFDLNKALNRSAFKIDLKSSISQFVGVSKPSTTMVTNKKVFTSEWLMHLRDRGILLDPSQELDWSGKGQHVEYTDTDANEIPLRSENIMGHSQTAIIDSVRCRRIRLARKSISCNRRLKREDVVAEVEHLMKLQHSHVVRLVGTYTLRKNLAILLYPAAEWDLDAFMDEALEQTVTSSKTGSSMELVAEALREFFGCLSIAIAFIHERNVKHMDIKPKNILVKRKGPTSYKVYIADFGIARSYKSAADCETDSPVSFTRIYAAPEVVLQDTRGFSADIFSLGAVFMEMIATLCSLSLRALDERQRMLDLRKRNSGNLAFYANIDVVLAWYGGIIKTRLATWAHEEGEVFGLGTEVLNILPLMISEVTYFRPPASTLVEQMSSMSCLECDDGPEPFEAAD